MEETIHIYIDSILKSDTQSISSSKKRLWPSLIVSVRWLFKNPISGRTLIQNGLGLTVINSLAMAVEGFLSDLLVEYFDNYELEKTLKIKAIENSNWNSKVKIYKKTFTNNINKCECYEAIEILFYLRNNTAHGRTHREISVITIDTPQSQRIRSADKNYQKARQYFEKTGLLKEDDRLSNVEMLWQIKHAQFLLYQVESFLYSLLENNKSEKFNSIASELNNAFKMSI
jgi:hypothetical protein